jgi:FtsZ-interacting cell division protein ZipA
MNTWHLCTSTLTSDDVNAISGVVTAIATVALAIFAWRAWLSERAKTIKVRNERDEGVKKANDAIQLMAAESGISPAKVPKIRVEGDTMYINTTGE